MVLGQGFHDRPSQGVFTRKKGKKKHHAFFYIGRYLEEILREWANKSKSLENMCHIET